MKATFKVRQDLSYWACDAGKFSPGEKHEVSGAEDVMGQIAGAEATGVLHDVHFDAEGRKVADAHVETQAQSEKRLVEAMGEINEEGRYSGPWMEGHLSQLELDVAAKEHGAQVEIGGT